MLLHSNVYCTSDVISVMFLYTALRMSCNIRSTSPILLQVAKTTLTEA